MKTTDRTHDEVREVILANHRDPNRGSYEGLTTSEIAEWHRRLMFGENDEAFPSEEEWSRVVD